MAQEDNGLILRGLLLFTAIGVLVAFVLGFLFLRPQPQVTATLQTPPEHTIPSALPHAGAFPANVSWYAIYQLGETMPSAPGWDIRYNAAIALARRGSASVPWPLIREMLDEQKQMRNNRVRLKDGSDVYDEATARAFMIGGLRALAAWHEKRSADPNHDVPTELREIYPVVDKLAQSEFVELKIQAEKARGTFFR